MSRYSTGFVDLLTLIIVVAISIALLMTLSYVNKIDTLSIHGKLNIFLNMNTHGSNIITLLETERGGLNGIEMLSVYNNDQIKKELKDILDILYGNNKYSLSLIKKDKTLLTFGKPKAYRDLLINNMELFWPLKGDIEITSGFGWRKLPSQMEYHKGIDLRCNGNDVFAPMDGIVVEAYVNCPEHRTDCTIKKRVEWGNHPCACNHGWGNNLKIKHFVDGYGYVYTVYHHLGQIFVKPGQRVKKGQIIGTCGQSGYSSGPHLHFGLLKDEVETKENAIDPCPYLPDPPSNCEQRLQSPGEKEQQSYIFSFPFPGGGKSEVIISK